VALPRPFALIRTEQQWRLSAHQDTALEGEVVQLAAVSRDDEVEPGDAPGLGAGVAFDSFCRLYHSVPAEGRLERFLWRASDPSCPTNEQPSLVDLFGGPVGAAVGDFRVHSEAGALRQPRGVAVDSSERLFVAETGARRILVYDLWSRRLLRKVQLNAQPLDLAARGRNVWATLAPPAGILRLQARSAPRLVSLPAEITAPERIALAPDGSVFVLDTPGPAARVIPLARPAQAFAVPFATDLEFVEDGGDLFLVVARFPGQDFLRLRVASDSIEQVGSLKARGYDGLGIVRTPDNRIGFWTPRGFRHAVAARRRYAREGRVTTFRLDSGEFNTIWGRLFLDACIPRETEVRAHFIAADEPPEEATLPRTPPANQISAVILRPDLMPPMPPVSLVPGEGDVDYVLHRRETGRELPFVRMAANDPFETYETPIHAGPGRFLWVTLELTGNTQFTPRVRCLRAEYPSHDYLRRLPKLFSREQAAASFLRRYLATFEGVLGKLEAESDARHVLIDPRSAPGEVLPWLGSFVGLVMDERWPETVRRQLLEEVIWLFRFRGTVAGLTRFLEIYLGVRPILIEKFRLRGLGGSILGSTDVGELTSRSVLGGGFRVGGAVGSAEASPLSETADDAFQTHAHRFAVIVPRALSTEQLQVVEHILDVHRPAHTLVQVCTVAAGMRVGRGLHAGLTSIIGRTGAFEILQVGGTSIGRNAVVGRPVAGTHLGASRLGRDGRVG
jgi:phage tail-like protein